MARYIDADALLSRLPDDLPYKASVKRVLMQAPAAAVIPLSEVAREIFEEIERLLSSNQSGEFRGDSIEWFDYYDLHLAECIAKLKKKYTKEEHA